MNGDLSLSQALGGLRIANPDSDDDDDVPEKVPAEAAAAAAAAAETRIPAAEPAPSLEPVPRPRSRPETTTTAATAAVASIGGSREEETLLLPHGPGADTQTPSAQPFARADGFQHRPPPPPSHHYGHHQQQHQRQRQHQHQYQHHLHLHHQHQHHFRERDGDQPPYSPYPFIPTGTPDTAGRPAVSDSPDPRLFRPQHSDPTLAPAQQQQQLRRAHSARLSPTIPLDHATGGPADQVQIWGGGGGGAWSSSSSVAGSRSAAFTVTKTGSSPHYAFGLSRTESRAGSAYASPAISREPSQRLRMNNSNRQGAGAGTAAAAAASAAALPSPGASAPPSRGRISRGMTTGYLAQSQQSVQSQHPSHMSHQSHQSQQLTTYASSSSSTVVTTAPTSSEDWKDRGAAVGVRKEVDANGRTVMRTVKKGVRDFSFGRVLGEGSYSTVYLATDRQTLKEYAIKVLDKKHIIKEKKIKYVNIEKNTLNRLTDHPGIVRLYYTFQDETSLYYVLDLCTGGELLGVLKKTGTFDEECTRFYGAQILDAVDYMHSRGIIHRDLKPENVLLDDQMHIKITDFGTAKQLRDPREPGAGADPDNGGGGSSGPGTDADDDGRAASFVGTAEYVSPELLTSKNACKASDLWAFGCIVYQLLVGRPPFKAGTEYLTFQKIVGLDYDFPAGFPPAGRDLVERCLVLDPARRLTIEHIKNHAFFKGQPFGKVLWRTKSPRLRPYVPPPAPSDGVAAATTAQQQDPHQQQPSRPPNGSTSAAPPPPNSSNGSTRPSRIITELPPPSQLDLEWSPVLTRTNERILKLGDLLVISSPLPTSPQGKGADHGDGHKKLARFFGGSTTKKRQRLVVVTSAGRILLAPAGGEEKRAKQEISLTAADCSWKSQVDVKGLKVWCVDVAGMHYTFEEPKPSSSAPASANDTPPPTAEEWIESLEKSKDLAISQGSDNGFSDMPSAVSSPSSTLTGRGGYSEGYGSGAGDRPSRTHLTKNQLSEEAKKNRFSKRHSKNGLGSAF